MNAVLRLEPGGVRVVMAPEVASRIVLDWLQGRESELRLPRMELERLAAALETTGPDRGGSKHDDADEASVQN